MKNFRLALLAAAFLLTGSAIFAFKTTQEKQETVTSYYFELKPGGDKMIRTDWIPASNDPSCPATHTDDPCRLILPTNGANPSVADFNDVLLGSDDFEQAYERVSYRP